MTGPLHAATRADFTKTGDKRATRDSEPPGGLRLIPCRLFERTLDGVCVRGLRADRLEGEIGGGNHLACRERRGALDRKAQLPDVAGERMGLQQLPRVFAEAKGRPRRFRQEQLGERDNLPRRSRRGGTVTVRPERR